MLCCASLLSPSLRLAFSHEHLPLSYPYHDSQPRMLQIVGGLLEIPRETRADANFASVVSNNRLAQEAYLESLVVEGAFLVSFLILWFLYLIVMKCQGDEVGCASGRKFYPIVDEEEMDTERYTIESDTDESFLSRSQSFSRRSLMSRNNSSFRRQGSLQDVCGSSVGGASCELYLDDEEEDSFGNGNGNSTSNRSLVKPVMATHLSPGSPPSSPNSEKGTTVTPASTRSISRRKDPTMVDESREPEYLARLHIHAVHTDMVQRNAEDEMNNTRCWFCSDHPFRVQVRRRRTRFAFALFGLLSLVSCGLLLTGGAYEPLRSASFKALEATDDGVLVLDEIRYHMNTLRDSSWVAQDVIENNLPLDLSVICPDIPPQQFSTSFGVDTQDVILFIEAEFDNFVTLALENIDQVNEASNNVRSVLVEVNRTIHEVEDRMWLFPFLVSCISILTIIQLYAVARATWWKTLARNDGNSSLLMGAGGGGGSIRSLTSSSTSSKSKSCFRRSISWIVIPLLLLLIVIGWGLTIGLAFSTVITSDICTTGDSSEGTPEQTIRQILKRQGYAENSTEFERVTSYTEVR